MTGSPVLQRTSGRTVLALFAIFSLLLSTMALLTVQPVRAVVNTAVLALSEDCSSDMKQIEISGERWLLQGDVHSNAGIHVNGNFIHADGEVRFNGAEPEPDCIYEESGNDNTGGFDAPFSAPPMEDPLFAVPDPDDCRFDFSGQGPIDLNGQDGGAGEEDVWEDDFTLKEGLYCHDDQLQQSRQGVSGRVSFYSTGYIDLSGGSDTDLTAYREDGVLSHSEAFGADAVKLSGSGLASKDSFYRGILYAPNGEGEVSGQFITTGCIVALTVKLDGNDNTVGACDLGPPPDPTISIVKENNTDGPVNPGDSVDFTLTVTITDSNGEDVTVEDTIPAGFDDPAPADIGQGGTFDGGVTPPGDGGVITWTIESPGDGDHVLTYTLTVSESITEDTTLTNVAVVTYPGSNCPQDEPQLLGGQGDDPCDDDSTVTVDVPPLEPSLVIDKVADTETIEISGPADAPVADPSVVTWTLTYTLTNGPVDNAVITDEVPVGFVFLDASDGGTFADGTVTWTFLELTASGSVSFRTTVDPETISRTAPTENVAVIDSDQTPPDEGEDAVTVEVIPPVAGGNPTPEVPDTALGLGIGGEPVTVPIELLATLFLGSLGALALANVRSWSSRRR